MNEDRQRTLVLVDDEPDMLGALRRCLRRTGHSIESFSNPQEALQRISAEAVDLIISDVDMPEMNGHELMSAVRRSRPEAVRVLLTGAATKESAVRAINEGEVHRFLEKPFDPDRLRELVAEALARKDELARQSRASMQAERRTLLLEALEREHPGITHVDRDEDGVYSFDVQGAVAAAEKLGLGGKTES